MKKDFGAVIARFQTPHLHEGHKFIIEHTLKNHDNLIICLGVHQSANSEEYPLDFRTRQLMLQAEYPEAIIIAVPDKKLNSTWSRTLDAKIKEVLPSMSDCTLYGSRDSFANSYSGTFKVVEVESPNVLWSATALREEVVNKAINDEKFRIGMMYQVSKQYPRVHTTVDIVVIRDNKILLAQKPEETGWRFTGGFADPKGEGFEDDAIREATEELKEEGGNLRFDRDSLTYLGSFTIDDWRYRKVKKQKIKTILFLVESPEGNVVPSDDIAFAKWVAVEDLHKEQIESEHMPLLNRLIDHLTYRNSLISILSKNYIEVDDIIELRKLLKIK